MSGSRRALHATVLLAVGATAVAGGVVLLTVMAAAILRMGFHSLHALLSWLPMFDTVAASRPVPQYDFLSPSLAALGGIMLFSVGWVAVVRGVTAAWPARFDRTHRNLDADGHAVLGNETTVC